MLNNLATENYWSRKLSGNLSMLDIYRQDNADGSDSVQYELLLPAEVSEKIAKLTAGSAAGRYIYFLSVYKALLFRFSGTEDIIVAAGAQHLSGKVPEEPNILFLRSSLSTGHTAKILLENTRQVVIEAYKFQNYSFTNIISSILKDAKESTDALFQAGITVEGINYPPFGLADKCGIHVYIAADNKITFTCNNVREELFARQLSDHFLFLSDALASSPDIALDQLAWVSPQEKDRMADQVCNALAMNSSPATILHAFAENAASSPEAPAVYFNGSCLTYGELNEYSNALAGYLRDKCNIRSGDIVAISLSSSFGLLISIIAVLKTGAAVLPVDPATPEARINQLLGDSRSAVFIGNLLSCERADIACINQASVEEIARTFIPSSAPEPGEPNSIAYIIYTSGSTGQPKGVQITHGNLVCQFEWFREYFNFRPDDVLAQKTTIGFVDSILELLFPVTVGRSSVHLRPYDDITRDVPKLMQWLADSGTTIVQFVPSVYDHIASAADVSMLSCLRALILSGEELKRTYDLPFEVYNIYGSSECSAYSLVYKLTGSETGKIPIGRPVKGTHAYIVNGQGALLPPFIMGELYITGHTVSLGYLHQAGLTGERFFSDIFNPSFTAYRTGDYARMLPDGNIQYLGRKDRQLKIRGQRIEPGEVEAVIRSHPAISEVVITATGNEEGRRLLAYITVKSDVAYPIGQALKMNKRNPRKYEQLYNLPNGLLVYPLNKREAELLYNEIFSDHTYLRHGITIRENDVVFDVGANIGLFSLYVALNFPGTQLYAFEPLKPIYDALSINTSLYDINVRTFNFGLSAADEEVEFVYYQHNSALSGRYAIEGVEKDVVRNFIKNDSASDQLTESELESMIEDRISGNAYNCRVRRLSDVIEENNITHIDLLKIDVEKSELDVIMGIDDRHWPIVRQVVIEVHDIDSRGDKIAEMLSKQGFSIYIEQEDLFRNTGIINIYATRDTASHSVVPPALRFNKGGLYTNIDLLLEDVANHCTKKLPAFMVPSDFRMMESIMHLPNGKVDLKSMEKASEAVVAGSRKIKQPGNSVEEKLHAIFCSVLGKDIGTDDNFFRNGGHSLNATRVVTRVMRDLEVKLTLRDIFDNPSVEALAAVVDKRAHTAYEPIAPTPASDKYEASYSQRRLWILCQQHEMSIAYNITGAFSWEGKFHEATFSRAINMLIERHEILRTIFVSEDGIPFQKVLSVSEAIFSLAYIDASGSPDKKGVVESAIKASAEEPFDLSLFPLMRGKCIALDSDKHVIIFSLHHIISDGWSVNLMVKELLSLYNQLVINGRHFIPALEIQYKDFAAWQRKMLESGKLSAHKAYWLEKLSGIQQPLQLPYDHDTSARFSTRGDTLTFVVEGQLLDNIRSISERYSTSAFVVFLAIFKILLRIETGQAKIHVGVPALGREHKHLEQQLGFYVNLLPVMTSIPPDVTFESLLKNMRADTAKAFQYQLYPFDLLAEELQFAREFGRSAFINTGFTWNPESSDLGLTTEGWRLRPLPVSISAVKHDLWLVADDLGSHVRCTFEYRSDLFERTTIQRMASALLWLGAQLMNKPDRPVTSHSLTSGAEPQAEIEIELDI